MALVKAQFNHVVAENEMKWESLHPRRGQDGYEWTAADAFVEFGIRITWSWQATPWSGQPDSELGSKARICRQDRRRTPNPRGRKETGGLSRDSFSAQAGTRSRQKGLWRQPRVQSRGASRLPRRTGRKNAGAYPYRHASL